MNTRQIFLNEVDTIILYDNLLSQESLQLLSYKYNVRDTNLLKKIKKCCQTDYAFSLLTIDNDLISFTFRKNKIYKTIHKLENIFSNKRNFCGITTDNKIIFWGNIPKINTFYYSIDKNKCEIYSLTNGFLIYNYPNVYLWKNSNSNISKIFKNVEWLIDVYGKFQLFKKYEEIYCIEDIDKKYICNMSTNNQKLNLVKSLIINKLINDKSRLIQILEYCIKY
jgi:hypothetical protein